MAIVFNPETGQFEEDDPYDPNDPLVGPLPGNDDWNIGTGRPPWTDPDNAPQDWLYDGQTRPQDIGHPAPAGMFWSFENGMWVVKQAPAPTTTTTTPGPTPGPTGYPTTPTGGGGYALPAAPGPLNYPMFNAPRFSAPEPFKYDPFSYESFEAPSLTEAQNEPGFDYALQQGLKAMENSKAYLGTYRTGGTIKGLNDYARNMANQNYNDVFRRKGETYDRNRGNAFGNWSANRENAADAYATNYGISRDVFDRNYTAAKDEYAPKARGAELQFARDWDQYVYEGDDAYRKWLATVQANS